MSKDVLFKVFKKEIETKYTRKQLKVISSFLILYKERQCGITKVYQTRARKSMSKKVKTKNLNKKFEEQLSQIYQLLDQEDFCNLFKICSVKTAYVNIKQPKVKIEKDRGAILKTQVLNYSSYVLSYSEKKALSTSKLFSLKCYKQPKIEVIFSEFETFFCQIQKFKSESKKSLEELKTNLKQLAANYHETKINLPFDLKANQVKIINEIKENTKLVIQNNVHSNNLVLLDKKKYDFMIQKTLRNSKNYVKLENLNADDLIADIETKLQQLLYVLVIKKQLNNTCYQEMRPNGSTIPKVYGVFQPSTESLSLKFEHGNSVHSKLCKWLEKILLPVKEYYSEFSVDRIEDMAENIKSCIVKDSDMMSTHKFKHFLDKVDLSKVLNICCNYFFVEKRKSIRLQKENFIKLFEIATKTYFAHENDLYYRVNGIDSSSPFAKVLTDIFIGYQENKISSFLKSLKFYKRYYDEVFVIANSFRKNRTLNLEISNLDKSMKLCQTSIEVNEEIEFLNVSIKKKNKHCALSYFPDKGELNQIENYDIFSDIDSKLSEFKKLLKKVYRISTSQFLPKCLDHIQNIMLEKNYRSTLIKKIMDEESLSHLKRKSDYDKESTNHKKIDLNLPFKGNNSADLLRKQLENIVRKCYPTVKANVTFYNQPRLFSLESKKVQRASRTVYKFTCGCGSSYVGKTTQRLKTRIRQHVPAGLRRQLGKITRSRSTEKQSSAVARHLLNSASCGRKYEDGMFSVLAEARDDLQLSVLESLFISTHKPDLCTKTEQGRNVLWNS